MTIFSRFKILRRAQGRLRLGNMKPSLRGVLIDSHVAAIAIAVLLVWSLEGGFQALCTLLWPVVTYLLTAVAIFGIPYHNFTTEDRYVLVTAVSYLLGALSNLAAAWALAYLVYGLGPMRSLAKHYANLSGRNFA
jgi:hypothetical protein